MKRILYTLVAALFLLSGALSAQQTTYYIAPGGTGTGLPLPGDSSVWDNAASSINSIINNVSGDVIFCLKAGTYGPIKIWGQSNITSVKIFGGFSGNEILPMPSFRDLDDPANRTIIEGRNDGSTGSSYHYPALWLETNFAGTTVVDGLTLRGTGSQSSLALRLVYAVNTIINRCRFEGTDGSGSLIFVEGIPNGSAHLAIINSVIANNSCTRIAQCGYGVKFINTTIADNSCSEFMNLYLRTQDTYELKNSIVTNTSTTVSGYWPVYVYNSVVDDFTDFYDTGIGNYSGINLEFTSGNPDDPYACVPNPYTTAGGDMNHIMSYIQTLNDPYDIIGVMRVSGTSIDIGAYQGSQIVPMRQEAPGRMEIEDSENIELPAALGIYPTDLRSGETLYFEKDIDSSLTARIYSANGVEVYSSQLTSPVEQVSVSCPAGIYIIIVTDDATGERISQEKIVVH